VTPAEGAEPKMDVGLTSCEVTEENQFWAEPRVCIPRSMETYQGEPNERNHL